MGCLCSKKELLLTKEDTKETIDKKYPQALINKLDSLHSEYENYITRSNNTSRINELEDLILLVGELKEVIYESTPDDFTIMCFNMMADDLDKCKPYVIFCNICKLLIVESLPNDIEELIKIAHTPNKPPIPNDMELCKKFIQNNMNNKLNLKIAKLCYKILYFEHKHANTMEKDKYEKMLNLFTLDPISSTSFY